MSILATSFNTLSYNGKLIEVANPNYPGYIFNISQQDTDRIAQEEIPLKDILGTFFYQMQPCTKYRFDDGKDVSSADLIAFSDVPGETTFTFVQDPAIYLKNE